MSKITVGNRIKNARKAKGITQKQLAIMLDCAHTTISKYEQGEIENMPRPRMKQMAEILDVPPVVLFELEEKEKPTDNTVDELSPTKKALVARVMMMSPADLEKLEKMLDLLEAR